MSPGILQAPSRKDRCDGLRMFQRVGQDRRAQIRNDSLETFGIACQFTGPLGISLALRVFRGLTELTPKGALQIIQLRVPAEAPFCLQHSDRGQAGEHGDRVLHEFPLSSTVGPVYVEVL